MQKEILILDNDQEIGQELAQLIQNEINMDVVYCENIEEAIEQNKHHVFKLIIFDPLCPSSFDGKKFIESVRMFNSINVQTPMLIFTEDIEFVSDFSQKYSIHPETKLGPITKVLNPIKQYLKL